MLVSQRAHHPLVGGMHVKQTTIRLSPCQCFQKRAYSPFFLVNGQSLGKVLWETRNKISGRFKPNIDNPSDSPLVKAIKNIIKDMLQVEPENRPTISEVVMRLTELRASEEIAGRPLEPVKSRSSKTSAMTGKCLNSSN